MSIHLEPPRAGSETALRGMELHVMRERTTKAVKVDARKYSTGAVGALIYYYIAPVATI